ncbi:DUF2254 domain-containing protein [Streptomyces sp. DH37]|uniref:DUF2254 domain-containing protein n=1 Tax=Streptomyces sp. DH37 TaxID=3040122 RepID=UPI002441922D|nr:DUF2254 domain-containing protein [Streptomyces sp. DH37]MDG9701887.1 DUF2254 domain-containing protein [Streptomyces sp. DH37]
MKLLQRNRSPRAETSRSPLWTWPTAGGGIALVAAMLLERVRPRSGTGPAALWPGDHSSASTMLQVVATSSVTVATLAFSVTVVTLQLASQQFSPRLLRRYAHDRVLKAVLTVLLTTLVFALTTLAFMNSDEALPVVALLLASALGVASLAAVLGFLSHIVRKLRVDSMMLDVHDETGDAIRMFYPARDDPRPRSPDELDLDEARGATVYGRSSGFVRLVDVGALVACARRSDTVVRLSIRPGDLLVAGNPIATVWARDPSADPPDPYADGTAAAVDDAVRLGYERTLEQDVAFGFRQLEDIAVKAMSPGINDPVTASTAVGHMADLLVRLAGRRLGPTLHEDGDGVGRAVVPDRDLRYYLDLACGQLRRFSAGEPTVLAALLRLLRDLATAVHGDDRNAAEVRQAADLVRDTMDSSVGPADAERVHDLHRRVLAALDGRTVEAYADRSGETRSM